MFIKTETIIGFKLPDEYLQMEKFKSEQNMDEWKVDIDTQFTYFSRQTFNMIKTEGILEWKDITESQK